MKPPGPLTYKVKTSFLSSNRKLPAYSIGHKHSKSIMLVNNDPSIPDPGTYQLTDVIRSDGKYPYSKYSSSKMYSIARRTDNLLVKRLSKKILFSIL